MANRFNVAESDLYGRKIFLLGTSDLGPLNTPVQAMSPSHVKSVFGEKGTLLDAYRVIKEGIVVFLFTQIDNTIMLRMVVLQVH